MRLSIGIKCNNVIVIKITAAVIVTANLCFFITQIIRGEGGWDIGRGLGRLLLRGLGCMRAADGSIGI